MREQTGKEDIIKNWIDGEGEMEMDKLVSTQKGIDAVCNSLSRFLRKKNERYGDSANNPRKIFSKLDVDNSICVRIDDKLNRVINSDELRKNDVVDIAGYLVLLMVSKGWLDFDEFLD